MIEDGVTPRGIEYAGPGSACLLDARHGSGTCALVGPSPERRAAPIPRLAGSAEDSLFVLGRTVLVTGGSGIRGRETVLASVLRGAEAVLASPANGFTTGSDIRVGVGMP